MTLYALDLFSGIGGNSVGLKDYVRTVAYCEADRHAQAVLLSRMADGSIPRAPICTDVTKLDGRDFNGHVDFIIAGFPCQDISVAGKGAGLAGERSGLFFEVVRLAKEVQPTFLFLENVPAIRTRGLDTVIQELTEAGYDCRWTMLSAAEVGAPHKRERWFCLARRRMDDADNCDRRQLRGLSGAYGTEVESEVKGEVQTDQSRDASQGAIILANANAERYPPKSGYEKADGTKFPGAGRVCPPLAHTNRQGLEVGQRESGDNGTEQSTIERSGWWTTEPNVGRVAHGVSQRVDRIKRLGNAVVPAQAREAFEILMGIKTNAGCA